MMSPRSRSRGITGIRESKRRQTGMAQPLSIQPVSCWASATTARGGAKDKQRNPQATVSEVGARMSGNNTATDIELANSQPCSRSSSETKEVRAKGGRYNEQAAFLNVVLSMVKDKDLEHVTFDEGNLVLKDPRRLAMEVLPRYFRHNKFASFQRQLHYFGFRKIVGKGKVEPQVFYNCTLKGKEPEAILMLQRRTKIGEESNKSTPTSLSTGSKYSDKFPEDIFSLPGAATHNRAVPTTKRICRGDVAKYKTMQGGQLSSIPANSGGDDGQSNRRNSRRYPPSRRIEFGLHETFASGGGGGGGCDGGGHSSSSSSSSSSDGARSGCNDNGTAGDSGRGCADERGGDGIPTLITALSSSRIEDDGGSSGNRPHRLRQQRVLQPHCRGTAERQNAGDGQPSALLLLPPAMVGTDMKGGCEGEKVDRWDHRTFCGWQRPRSSKNGGDRGSGECIVGVDGNDGDDGIRVNDTSPCFETAAKGYTTSSTGCVDIGNSKNGRSNNDTALLQPTASRKRKYDTGDSISGSIEHLLTLVQHEIEDSHRGGRRPDWNTSPSPSQRRQVCSYAAQGYGGTGFSGSHSHHVVESSAVPVHETHNLTGHREEKVAGLNRYDGSPTKPALVTMKTFCPPSSHTVPPPQARGNSCPDFSPGLTNGYSPLRCPPRDAEFTRKNFGDSLLADSVGSSMYGDEWNFGGNRGTGDGDGSSAEDTVVAGNCGYTGRERAEPRTRAQYFDATTAASDAAFFDKDVPRAIESSSRSRGSGGDWSPDQLPPTPSPLSLYRLAHHASPSKLGLW